MQVQEARNGEIVCADTPAPALTKPFPVLPGLNVQETAPIPRTPAMNRSIFPRNRLDLPEIRLKSVALR